MDDAAIRITAFVQARRRALLGLAYLLVSNRNDSEDLLQEALTRCLPHWHKVQDDPEGYIRRTMVRLAIDGSRVRARRPETLMDPPERTTQVDPTDQVDDRAVIVGALRVLPARQRAAVVLRMYVGLDESSAAEAMGCSVGNVKSLTSKGLARMRLAQQAESKVGGRA